MLTLLSSTSPEAFVVMASVPRTLVQKFSRATLLLAECFHFYGMEINWKPGKTEAIIALRRKHAKLEKMK